MQDSVHDESLTGATVPALAPFALALDLLLELARLVLCVAEPARPLCTAQCVERVLGGVPPFLVDLGLGEVQQACRLEGTDLGHTAPVSDRVGPTVLPLADLGELRVALRLVGLHFDNGRVTVRAIWSRMSTVTLW